MAGSGDHDGGAHDHHDPVDSSPADAFRPAAGAEQKKIQQIQIQSESRELLRGFLLFLSVIRCIKVLNM